jgi:choline dehydrogenase-like flavoprotein
VLQATTPRVRALTRLAIRAIEWSAFPRRFSRLAPEARQRALARMETSRLAPKRDLVIVAKALCGVAWASDPKVPAQLGVTSGCVRVEGAVPPPTLAPRLQAENLRTPGGELERCDVAIIGSGAGGASAARVLAEAGLDVIVLEAGPYRDHRDFTPDAIETVTNLYRDAGLTVLEGRPPIPVPVGRCVGGTTVINSGTCFPAPPGVLLRWRDEYGIPFATELDADYERLERDLRVQPVDPETAGRNAALCRAGAEAIGASNGPITRNAGDVICCSSCPNGCAIDAKTAMHVSELPPAVAAGARIRAEATVEEILIEHGRAVGVRARAAGGPYEVRARAVIAAGGAYGTPELLLRQGLANSSGALGRHLRVQPACWVGARFDEPVRGWDGIMQSWYVDEWHDRGLLLEATFTPLAFGAQWMPGAGVEYSERMAAFDRLGVIGPHCADTSEGRVTVKGGAMRLGYRLNDRDADVLRFGIARAAEIHFAAGATEVYPQIGGLPTLRPGEQDRVLSARPSDLRLEGFHPMGTARMGSDPSVSVVGPTGETHDVPGLYVADASLFPTSLGVNPMLTIMAFSRHIARGLAERLSG